MRRPSSLVLALVVGLSLGAGCTSKLAAKPLADILVADARIGAVCSGPATMMGCIVSVYDSTAGTSLAANVAVQKGDTLWRTRPCTVNQTVVIGATFIGTAPGRSNSAPVGARGTGACTAQAGQPSPVIIVEIVG